MNINLITNFVRHGRVDVENVLLTMLCIRRGDNILVMRLYFKHYIFEVNFE